MDVVFRFGLTVPDMMASGETVWQMVMEDLYMQKVMFMKVSGLKIKPMDLGFTLIITEVDTKDNGSRINNMVMVLNNGQMVPNTKDSMNKA